MRPDRAAAALGLVLILGMAAPPRAADRTDRERIESQLMCYCGCANLTIRSCTCGTAEAVRQEITQRLSGGETPEQVVAAFVARHGEQILAAPAKRGFNLMAWAAPFGVVLIASAALVFAVRRWASRAAHPAGHPPSAPASGGTDLSAKQQDLMARMEREIREEL
jgi:cytochrome c-type biogenesis protein CcmH/NrfF